MLQSPDMISLSLPFLNKIIRFILATHSCFIIDFIIPARNLLSDLIADLISVSQTSFNSNSEGSKSQYE